MVTRRPTHFVSLSGSSKMAISSRPRLSHSYLAQTGHSKRKAPARGESESAGWAPFLDPPGSVLIPARNPATSADNLPQLLDRKAYRSICTGRVLGAVMQCLACRADKILLVDVVRDDSMKVPVIECRTYMCSACRHIARRVVFSRVEKPIPCPAVIPTPIDKVCTAHVAGPSAWTKAVEKVRSKQAALAEQQQPRGV
jgi:hypothetical protein